MRFTNTPHISVCLAEKQSEYAALLTDTPECLVTVLYFINRIVVSLTMLSPGFLLFGQLFIVVMPFI
jgi:hypothetical protein